jgi:hypothetical protein
LAGNGACPATVELIARIGCGAAQPFELPTVALSFELAIINPGQAGEDISDLVIVSPGLPTEAVGAAGETGGSFRR